MYLDFRDEVLSVLRTNGSDTSKPHAVEYHVYVPKKVFTDKMANKVKESGYVVKIQRAGKHWLCIAGKTFVPEEADLNDHARFFDQIANAVGGVFDGWQAEIID